MIKLSVIVPVYNSEKYLEACLNSLVNQTLKDIEILIGNDGSTDNSLDIINQFTSKYENIKSFNLEHMGVAGIRNFLLSKATSEYIGFLDSDDIVEITMYEKMVNRAIIDKADIVICDYNEVHDTFTIKKSGLFLGDIKNKLLLPPSLCNKIFRKKLFTNKQFSNIMIGEDLVMVTSILRDTNKIAYVGEPLYYYYKRNNSIMNQNAYKEYWNDIFTAFNLIFKNIGKSEEVEFLFIQHVLRDSSIKFMYYKEGRSSLENIITITNDNFPKFYKNKYYKKQNWRYRFICRAIYYKQYWLVKLIRKILKSDS